MTQSTLPPSKVPAQLRAGLVALTILVGGGGAAVYKADSDTQRLLKNQYIQAVAADPHVSEAVKVAMVMGSYYESSFRHIGTPYVDKLGKGQPLTVCNGLTGKGVIAGKYYSPAECYSMERVRYVGYEKALVKDIPRWREATVYQQASYLDFVHNKGETNFKTSTMRRKTLEGDFVGACRENPKWNKGTVAGVSTVLPGLQVRGDANAELCEEGLK